MLLKHSFGGSYNENICPDGERLGEFRDNEAFSTVEEALNIFPIYVPRTYPCKAVKVK